jgi:SIR2-like domain
MMARLVELLLITGAGASRELGVSDSKLPLMGDWSQALCAALNERENGLAGACMLDPDLDGPQFEQALGELLEWDRVHYLADKYEGLAAPKPGGSVKPGALEARQKTQERLNVLKETLHGTLYRQFSHVAVDDDKAMSAYGGLLKQLGDPSLTLATTNYDRSAESALLSLGHNVLNGFTGQPPRLQIFEPSNLVERSGEGTPILHLHGAVGWYERNGRVILENAEEDYDPSRGSPVVLYPDPQKIPTENAIVAELWRELDVALKQAERILVLGHSLHDQALVDRLCDLSREQKLAVSFCSKEDKERISELMPSSALLFQALFKPEAQLAEKARKHLN